MLAIPHMIVTYFIFNYSQFTFPKVGFEILTNLTLENNFIPHPQFSFNGVSWSVSTEMFFIFRSLS
jgi:peptidoglycan/LPS O-acetylase OafA/YrhL